MGHKPRKPCGFLSFVAWSLRFNRTPLPEGGGRDRNNGRGELDILPEAGASTVEVLGGPAEVDCSGGPLLVGQPRWRCHSGCTLSGSTQGGSSHQGGDNSATRYSPCNLAPSRS